MITEALEGALRAGPKFIYVLPNFQNPTGSTLRLNFSNAAPEKIPEGIMRLGDVLHEKIALALLAA